MTGGGPEARDLAAKVSDAFINFARKGNPNHGGLPDWPAFTPTNGETMIFNTRSRSGMIRTARSARLSRRSVAAKN